MGARARKVLGGLLVAVVAWAAALGVMEEGPFASVVQVLPFWSVVAFGWYAAVTIGWELLTFRECEKESKELEMEREQAIADLTKRGLVFTDDDSKKDA